MNQVHADLHLYATILAPGQSVYHSFQQPLKGGKPRKAYVHVVRPPPPFSLPFFPASHHENQNQKKTALTLSCWLASRQIQTSGYNTSPAYPASKGARINVNDELDLGEGDGLFVEGGQPGRQMGLVNTGDKNAEVLVFDLGE